MSTKPLAQPPVPTMTSQSVIPPIAPASVSPGVPEELGADIIARPLVMPDFINIRPAPTAKDLSFRWIYNDIRRVSQCKAQGWRVATSADVDKGQLSPYVQNGGAQFLNGDLILMCIKREIYLGALRYKHEVAAKLADSRVANTISAKQAAAALGNAGAGRAGLDAFGQPKMVAFAPDGTDLSHMPPGGEVSRLSHEGGPEILNR